MDLEAPVKKLAVRPCHGIGHGTEHKAEGRAIASVQRLLSRLARAVIPSWSCSSSGGVAPSSGRSKGRWFL